ncbi:MAG: transcriptional regulator [Planctomycetaceae bacterium]|nr:transcriptional regulator [Planctomycetaceae bacterium]
MKASTRLNDATANELPRELVELGRAIAALPEQQFRDLEPAYVRVVECVRRRRRILELVQEALSQLRLDIKYLMFDLDLTRKERDEFKSQLDELTQDDFGAN